MIFEKNFKIQTFIPPVVVSTMGKIFVCPGWIDITNKVVNMSLEMIQSEVMKRWEQVNPKETTFKPEYKIHEMVTSSNGKTEYDVTFDGVHWNCTCVGFSFRRDCKHVKQTKLKHKK